MELPLSLLRSDISSTFRIWPEGERIGTLDVVYVKSHNPLGPLPEPIIWRRKLPLFVGEVREAAMPHGPRCPDCKGTRVVRNGKRKGIQRYRCKECRRCFTELTGTLFEGLHKREEFLRFCVCMVRGLSVRRAAQEAGISKNTSFDWRHRIISVLAKADSDVRLDGIVEIAQWPFILMDKGRHGQAPRSSSRKRRRYSSFLRNDPDQQKGFLLFAIDRTGRARAELIIPEDGRTFGSAMRNIVSKNAKVCASKGPGIWRPVTDYPEPIYWQGLWKGRKYVKDQALMHPLFHSNNARWLIYEFRNWMRRFCGVSTKYLLRYVSWFWRVVSYGFMRDEHAAKVVLFDALGSTS